MSFCFCWQPVFVIWNFVVKPCRRVKESKNSSEFASSPSCHHMWIKRLECFAMPVTRSQLSASDRKVAWRAILRRQTRGPGASSTKTGVSTSWSWSSKEADRCSQRDRPVSFHYELCDFRVSSLADTFLLTSSSTLSWPTKTQTSNGSRSNWLTSKNNLRLTKNSNWRMNREGN